MTRTKSSAPAGTSGRGQRLFDWLCRRAAKDRDGLARTLAARVDASRVPDGGCAPWTGQVNPNGYGNLTAWLDGQTRLTFYAHQIFWTLANARPIPDDREIDHVCGNALCVNPAHLALATREENLRRRDARQEGGA